MPRVNPRPRPSGQVRIIGGAWRGRRLPVVDQPGLRPTPDRVRETVFNWLMPILPGARCLDLFAGTGVLGMECLSRGAAEAWLVEKDANVVEALRENVRRLPAAGASVIHADALAYLRESPPSPVDVVFLDPPFQSDLREKAAVLLEERGWIRPGGLIYIEAPKEVPLKLPSRWSVVRAKTAGEVDYYLAKKD